MIDDLGLYTFGGLLMTSVVGLHLGHDGGCAIVKDGKVAVAIAEERLTRRKTRKWLVAITSILS